MEQNHKKYIVVFLILTKLMEEKKLDANTALSLTSHVMHVVQSSKLKFSDNEIIDVTKSFILEIAKGKDGKLGTDDDVISSDVLNEINTMISSSMFDDVLKMCNDAVKFNKINTTRALFCLAKCWL